MTESTNRQAEQTQLIEIARQEAWIKTPFSYIKPGAKLTLLQTDTMLMVSDHLQEYIGDYFNLGLNRADVKPRALFSKYMLEHGGGSGDGSASFIPAEKEGKPMKGKVTAKSGSTVKLRQKPGTDCTIYWNIPVGTEVEIVDQRENWSKCICSGLTGWMKNEFIRMDREKDLPIAPEPAVSEDPSQFEDAQSDPELEQALALLSDVYEVLKDLCNRILGTIGRG